MSSCFEPVSVLTISTVAPGMTPALSLTVPDMLPRVSCAPTGSAMANDSSSATNSFACFYSLAQARPTRIRTGKMIGTVKNATGAAMASQNKMRVQVVGFTSWLLDRRSGQSFTYWRGVSRRHFTSYREMIVSLNGMLNGPSRRSVPRFLEIRCEERPIVRECFHDPLVCRDPVDGDEIRPG